MIPRLRAASVAMVLAVTAALAGVGVAATATSASAATPGAATIDTGTTALDGAARKAKKKKKKKKKTVQCPVNRTGFVPTRFAIPGLTPWRRVVKVGLTRSGEMGSPALTSSGKQAVGWYPSAHPGATFGSVPLDAHTYPNGSALGNKMLRSLRKGNVVLLAGAKNRWACYTVQKRQSVPHRAVNTRVLFNKVSAPRAVIVVCSGKRLGPGNWTHRTIWYLKPYTGKY